MDGSAAAQADVHSEVDTTVVDSREWNTEFVYRKLAGYRRAGPLSQRAHLGTVAVVREYWYELSE